MHTIVSSIVPAVARAGQVPLIDPRGPGDHQFRLVWDVPGDWRGDRSVDVQIRDQMIGSIFRAKDGARPNLADPDARTAVRALRDALLSHRQERDKDAANLPPRWYRTPTAEAGRFAFGTMHTSADQSQMAYTAVAGQLATVSPATGRVLAAAQALYPFLVTD